MATRSQLVDELLKFPAPDRAEAARTLLASLHDGGDPVAAESAWQDELASRVQQIENGEVELEDGPTVMAELRQRARARLARRAQ